MQELPTQPSHEIILLCVPPQSLPRQRMPHPHQRISLDFSQRLKHALCTRSIACTEHGLVAPASRRRFYAAMNMQKSPAGRRATKPSTPQQSVGRPIQLFELWEKSRKAVWVPLWASFSEMDLTETDVPLWNIPTSASFPHIGIKSARRSIAAG